MVRESDTAARRLVIEHEAIAGYMPAMTMPFRLGTNVEATPWRSGDRIRFQLRVTGETSWIEDLVLLERAEPSAPTSDVDPASSTAAGTPAAPPAGGVHPLRAHRFTNELGATMSLEDLRGRALAVTFVFTRCPIPDYCPRLTRNFAEAGAQLAAEAARGGPTNYHFISVTIDPGFDTPDVLRRYAKHHGYDPRHWSFWTGEPEWIEAFMTQSGVTKGPDGNVFNHNLRTLIVAPDGRLLVNFPMGGDLTDAIVQALRQAMSGAGQPEPRTG